LKHLAILIAICLILAACGVKAPPMPKDYLPPAPAKDLRHTIDNNSVTLTWTAPEPEGSGGYRIEEARVFRLKTPIGDTVCENCPIIFNEAGKLSVTNPKMVYRETLEEGFQYRYKIVLYDENGIESGDSNIVRFAYPGEPED